jgi:hypothetical protein
MKSIIGLATGGGALASIWKAIPLWVKAPFMVGVILLAVAELTRDVNQALRSGRITEGEAIKADAQVVDPAQTRARIQTGQTVSGAERTIAVQYEALDADARKKQAEADAANDSEQELLAKKARRLRLTSTQQLKLQELQAKAQEVKIREAEAITKTAESTAAEAKAIAERKAAELNTVLIDIMSAGIQLFLKGMNEGEGKQKQRR